MVYQQLSLKPAAVKVATGQITPTRKMDYLSKLHPVQVEKTLML
jgi:hypothetical protein